MAVEHGVVDLGEERLVVEDALTRGDVHLNHVEPDGLVLETDKRQRDHSRCDGGVEPGMPSRADGVVQRRHPLMMVTPPDVAVPRRSGPNEPLGQLRREAVLPTVRGPSDQRAHRMRHDLGEVSPVNDILLRAQVRVQTTLYSLRHRQEGQGLVEYGLIIASIAVLLIIAMLFLAGKIDNLFSKTGTSVETPGPVLG